MMKNKNLKPLTLFSFVVFVLLGACKREEEIRPGLTGTWLNTTYYINGEGITRKGERKLEFGPGNTFVLRTSLYGTYPGQAADEESSWTEYRGTVTISDSTLVFAPQTERWWDSFYGDMTPKTLEVTTQRIFDDCRYMLNGRELDLYFTTYPLDYPEATEETFIKIK
ncbi:MAG TPA: hypothetical protein VF646_03760 [Cytophagales bacterium]